MGSVVGSVVGSLAVASCDSKVEVLIVDDQRDAATDAAAPSKALCQCGDAEVCAAGTCVALPSISAIAAGDRHTCRVSRGQLSCWGDNSSRQLGLGNDAPDTVTAPMRVPNRSYWLTVAAGSRHTCALREPGYLRCWGNDDQRQLGMASGNRQRDQQAEPLDEYTQLKCGGDNCCALRDAGALYCWGSNRDGNAGVGRDDGAPVEEPTQVDGDALRFRTFSVGRAHSCAIATDQTLWCWGATPRSSWGCRAETAPSRQCGSVRTTTGYGSQPAARRHAGFAEETSCTAGATMPMGRLGLGASGLTATWCQREIRRS